MRASRCLLIGIVVVPSLVGCSQLVTEQATKRVPGQVAKCGADNRATAEGQIVAGRLWMGDGTDSAAKLLDPYPLTPGERAAFVQMHSRAVQCRQIIMAHVDQSAAWQLPYLQRYAQRSDQLFDKLSSGELPVGLANKLSIESDRMLELDLASRPIDGVVDHATAGVRTDQARRERNADALLEQSKQIVASQTSPHLPATYCGWLGNTLNCASLRQGEAGGQLR